VGDLVGVMTDAELMKALAAEPAYSKPSTRVVACRLQGAGCEG
jgi:hypothetical protein